jgi:hypothetical protein
MMKASLVQNTTAEQQIPELPAAVLLRAQNMRHGSVSALVTAVADAAYTQT